MNAYRYAMVAAIAIGGLAGHALGRVLSLAGDEGWHEGFRVGYGARSAVQAAQSDPVFGIVPAGWTHPAAPGGPRHVCGIDQCSEVCAS